VCPSRKSGLVVELHFLYVFLYAVGAVLALLVAFVAWRRRAARGAVSIAVFSLGIAIWSGAFAAMWYVPTLEEQVFWERAASLGAWMVPVGFLTLAFTVAGMERWRTPGRVAIIAIVSFAFNNLEWLNPGRLFDAAFVAQKVGPYTHFAVVPGPLYWAFVAYAYTMMAVSLIIIIRAYVRSSGTERTQAGVLLVGALVPFIASVVTESGIVPLGGLDLAPFAFLPAGALWLIAIARGTLFEVLPLARSVLVEQMLDGVVVFDEEDHAVDVNPMALTMLHAPRAEVLGRPAEAVLSRVMGATAVLGDSGARHAVLPIVDGDSRYVDLGITPLSVGLGSPPAELVTLHDVTGERQASERLKLFRQVFDTADEGIIITLPDGTIVDVNDACTRMHGVTREEVLGANPRIFKSGRHDLDFYRRMWASLAETGLWRGEVWDRRADGSVFPKLLSIAAVKDENGETTHYVGMFSDITEIKTAENKLTQLATHDILTSLPNRALLEDRLNTVLARSRRRGSAAALFLFDLDHFKEVNDTLGHPAGDRLLVEIARRCLSVVRESDTIGRSGGDEFTVVVSDFAGAEDLALLARRLLSAIEKPVELGEREAHVTASIGIAVYPDDGDDADELTRNADLAMYRAKALGKNRFEFFGAVQQDEP